MRSPHDTIAAIATPLGEGGLGVIRVSGAKAIDVVQAHFVSSIDLRKVASHTCHFGSFASPQPSPLGRPGLPQSPIAPQSRVVPGGRSEAAGEAEIIDQIVVTLFRAPQSYTGEDVVEISGHGSPFTLQKILALCLREGARLAGPGEFTERAFLNGKIDLTQAEAVAELIRAKSDKAQSAALSQMQGGLSRQVRALRDQLLPLLAHIEVGLDHSDEDHDFLAPTQLAERCAAVQREIEAILKSARLSQILREGLRVVLLGRPNVGKSSLLNVLLKEERAIVTPTPGTTRDTLEESVHWNGIPVVLTDTAGLRRNTEDPIERLGIERTRRAVEQADVVVAVFDGSEPLTHEDDGVMNACLNKPHLLVQNKSDLPVVWNRETLRPRQRPPSPHVGEGTDGGNIAVLCPPPLSSPTPPLRHGGSAEATVAERGEECIRVSAKTGAGLDILVQAITRFALNEKAQASEARWLLNARHQAALQQAREALTQAAKAARSEAYEECVALELQTALGALGEIIGETTTDDLLEQIFSQFCIGK